MRRKIQQSMVLLITVTLLICCILFIAIVYQRNVEAAENELKQEADYIRAAIEIAGDSYLKQMDEVRVSTRVTLISPEGEILYDSHENEIVLDNHSDRPEFKAAIARGEGKDIRSSDTVHWKMIYYAMLLEDGNVLRVSKNIDTAFEQAYSIISVMAALAGVMIFFAFLLAKWQARRLIKPINQLNLDEPFKEDVYEELVPFLKRVDRQNREKQAAADMRKEFSANVSHELKTPLTSISGYAELMKNGLVKPEDMQMFSERIYNEANRMIVLIEDIIQLSKLDEHKVEQEKEAVDLYQLVREVCGRLAPQAAAQGVHIEITGEPVIYQGIRGILDEMVYNICDNAIKYNRENGQVTVWVGNTLKGIGIIVSDTGIGILKEEQVRIFERFYRVDKSHSRERGGTGLGLSIVKHGAKLHDAKIHVESEPGKGTKMEIIL